MRKIALGLISAMACTTAAQAEPFAGPYVGLQLNRDAYEVKAEGVDLGGGTELSFDGLSGNGVGGGVYVGYDMPFTPNFFAGLEANANISSASVSASVDGLADAKIKARESYGISARVGAKVAEATGIYARLGWQNTKFKARAFDGTATARLSETEDAFVYGAGLETSIGPNAAIRVEYSIEDYGSAGLNGALSDLAGAEVNGIRVDNNKLSLGATYRF